MRHQTSSSRVTLLTWFSDRSETPDASRMLFLFRNLIPGQNMRQRMLHEYLGKLLLAPDELMQLLEDC
jgi:hypothetical protein